MNQHMIHQHNYMIESCDDDEL